MKSSFPAFAAKNDQATKPFFSFIFPPYFWNFFFCNQSGKKIVYKHQNALWRSGDKTTKYRHLCIWTAKPWMVKPLSAGCVNTVVVYWIHQITYVQEKLALLRTRNKKLTLCGPAACCSYAKEHAHKMCFFSSPPPSILPPPPHLTVYIHAPIHTRIW